MGLPAARPQPSSDLPVATVEPLPLPQVEGLGPPPGVDPRPRHHVPPALRVVAQGVGDGVGQLLAALLEDGAGEVEEGIVGKRAPRLRPHQHPCPAARARRACPSARVLVAGPARISMTAAGASGSASRMARAMTPSTRKFWLRPLLAERPLPATMAAGSRKLGFIANEPSGRAATGASLDCLKMKAAAASGRPSPPWPKSPPPAPRR